MRAPGAAAPAGHATTAVLARGLADRRFCRALLAGRPPRLAPDERAAAAAVDAERLALFAGFITKVRHSDLFEHLPGTFALLRLHGVEIEVFRDYFLDHDPQPRGDTAAKVVAVLAHLARFASTPRGRAVLGLRDVLAHERCLWEVRHELARAPASAAAARPGAVVLGGPTRLARLLRDPYAVLEAAARGQRTRGRPRGARWWLYFAHAAAGELRTIEIDRDAAAMIEALLAARPRLPARLSARRRGAILARLAEAGVIRLEGGSP